MNYSIFKFFQKKYPQHFIVRHPYMGSLIITTFCFIFVIAYEPLNVHKAINLSFELTMLAYSIAFGFGVLLSVKFLKLFIYFDKTKWTVCKEMLSMVIVLLGLGLAIYFSAFIIEEPAKRWNLSAILDSFKKAALVGILPLLFFSIPNYRYLFGWEIIRTNSISSTNTESSEDRLITISSKLKKETLSFRIDQFIYGRSDGNYVDFYLFKKNKIHRESIRNSLDNIEQQLSGFPEFLRTHRAYIINLNKVVKKQGNSLGYRLALNNVEIEIPVSRKNVQLFDKYFNTED